MINRTALATFSALADEWAALDCDEYPDLVECEDCGEDFDRTYVAECPNGCEPEDG